MGKEIAIIGAGPSGLTSIKAALAEGLHPTAFEMSGGIGGVWGEAQHAAHQQGTAWPGMKSNISRHTGAFSDFPWPSTTPDFPTTEQHYAYLSAYAKEFKLLPCIQFESKVIEIKPKDNQWLVRWQQKGSLACQEKVFDAVIVASSKFAHPFIPQFKGLETVRHKMSHSADYQDSKPFVGKKVLVVGNSFSGTAIAEELAPVAALTIHHFRQEHWCVKRYRSADLNQQGPWLPRDLLKTYTNSQTPKSPEEEVKFLQKHCQEQQDFAEWQMTNASPMKFTIVEDYFKRCREEKIIFAKGEIDHFTEKGVKLTHGPFHEFDHVIFCTGYQRRLPFLPEHLRHLPNPYEDTLLSPNLAVIGMYEGARGAVFPIVDLQARLACGVFSGRCPLPSEETLFKEIKETPTKRDEIEFLNSLAKKIGILPDIKAYDSGFRHTLLDGAHTPQRFNLTGPGSNPEGAKKAIEATEFYRRELLDSQEKVPRLAKLCLFKINSSAIKKEKQDEMEVRSPVNRQ